MPTYEYECTNPKCRHRWDLFQSIKADPERECPKCGKRTATRLIGIGAAILSGGRTAEPAEPAAPAAKSTEASTASSTDAKGGAAAAGPAKADAAKPDAAKPATTTAEKPAETGKVNATHPAREGRGAGNLSDAIRRQRAAGQPSARKAPAAAPKRTAPRTGGARRGK